MLQLVDICFKKCREYSALLTGIVDSSPRRPRLGKQLQLQLGVERDCPYLLLWGIKLNTKNTLIVCVPLGRERGSHMENQRIAGLFKEPPPEDLNPKKE